MDSIFYASVLSYRVVVSHDPQRPEIFYVDMCRDGFCSHDLLFQMQKKFYRNDKLERVFNDSKGIFLKEFRTDGHISLIYTKHRDVMAQQHQDQLRQKIDPEIIRVFKRMKAENKIQTISVQTHKFYYNTLIPQLKRPPRSLYEETAAAVQSTQERLEKLKKIRQEYYAKQEYASCPHMMLAWKQAVYRGD